MHIAHRMIPERKTSSDTTARKPSESNRFYAGWFPWHNNCERLSKKKHLTIHDFGIPGRETEANRLSGFIKTQTRQLLANKEKHRNLLSRVATVHGLYDVHVRKLIRKKMAYLYCIEIVSSATAVAVLVLFMQQSFAVYSDLFSNSIRTFRMAVYVIFIFLNFFFSRIICSIHDSIKLTTKNAMLVLIYEKLSISDSSFLEVADNNLTHTLIYKKVEEYCNTIIFYPSIVSFSIFVLGLVIQYLKSGIFEDFVLLLLIVLRFSGSLIQETLKSRSRNKYSEVCMDQMKILYELISQYKSLNLKSLKEKYRHLMDRVTEKKMESVKWFQLNLCFDTFVMEALMLVCLLYAPYSAVNDPNRWKNSKISAVPEYSFIRAYFGLIYCCAATDLYLMRIQRSLSGYLQYRGSKKVFDRFFDINFSLNERSQKKDLFPDAASRGEVVFQGCHAAFRSRHSLKHVIDKILGLSKAPPEKKTPSGPLSNKRSILKDSQLSSNANRSHSGDYTIAIRNYSASFRSGAKVCIFDNGNLQCIHSFIGMLLSENILIEGTASIRGAVSYFNPNRMLLLVGKTIRDNILFGLPFKQERYEEILKVFGAQFGNYPGHDFFQVAEKGLNLRSEDVKTILFSRFLYQEADVFVIEDYFKDLDLSVVKDTIRLIVRHVLQKKTLFFVSNSLEMIRMADYVVEFDSELEHRTMERHEFLEEVERIDDDGDHMESNIPQLQAFKPRRSTRSSVTRMTSMKRVEVLRTKMRNSIFIENISLDEELAVYKKIVARQEEIKRILSKRNDPLSSLAYGIYLVHKKREEGKFLEEEQKKSGREIFRDVIFFFNIQKPTYRGTFLLFMSLGSRVLFSTAEYIIFRNCTTIETTPQPQNMRPRMSIFQPLILLAISYLLGFLTQSLAHSYFLRRSRTVNQIVLDSITNSSIKHILNKKSYNILKIVHQDLACIEINLPVLQRALLFKLSDLLVNTCIFAYFYSLVPLLPLAIVIWLLYRFTKKQLPVYLKLSQFNSTIESKIDDLNFQILRLIPGYRIAGRINELLRKAMKLIDSKSKVESEKNHILKRSVMNTWVFIILVFVILMKGIMLSCYLDITNFFRLSLSELIWANIYISRTLLEVITYPKIVINTVEICFSISRLVDFIQKQKSKSMMIKPTPRRLDLQAPIVFRQVSLTRGIQPILKRLSFKIQAKSRVCLFSVQGGGRSNIFDLLAKVIPRDSPDKSSISMFGHKIEDLEEDAIKSNVFLVERQPVLFEGTVRDNIDPYQQYDKEQLKQVFVDMEVEIIIRQLKKEKSIEITNSERKITWIQKKLTLYDRITDILPSLLEIANCDIEKMNESPPPAAKKDLQNDDQNQGGQRLPTEERGLLGAAEVDDENRFEDKPMEKVVSMELSLNSNNQQPASVSDQDQIFYSIIHSSIDQSGRRDRELEKKKLELSEPKSVEIVPRQFKNSRSVSVQGSQQLVHSSSHKSSLIEISKKSKATSPRHETSGQPSRSRNEKTNRSVDPQYSIYNSTVYKCRGLKHQTNSRSIISLGGLKCKSNAPEPKSYSNLKLDGTYSPNGRLFDTLNNNLPTSSATMSDFEGEYEAFLSTSVGFGGGNLSIEIRRYILFIRIILSKPKVLLIYEENLSFCRGVHHNLQVLDMHLPDSTVLVISRNLSQALFFDKVIFFDAGTIIEQGKPASLVSNERSYLHRFMREVDCETLSQLKQQIASNERFKPPSSALKPKKRVMQKRQPSRMTPFRLAENSHPSMFNIRLDDSTSQQHEERIINTIPVFPSPVFLIK